MANQIKNRDKSELELAWELREELLCREETEAYRVFHGPGEATSELRYFAIDRFQDHYWVTEWENSLSDQRFELNRSKIIRFLEEKNAKSVVGLKRPEKGIAPTSSVWSGSPAADGVIVNESGIKFLIQMTGSRHPGLFLDHLPLRLWLRKHSQSKKVLNTFAYTGSLSVASAVGGASEVTTLDLSKATLDWAKRNFELNSLPSSDHRWISGDYFEWLPRLKREKKKFDLVILDPPSFSHGKNGRFSTSKDLLRLHQVAIDVLAPGGVLVTSINSANVSRQKYEMDVFEAAESRNIRLKILKSIEQPSTFPTPLGDHSSRYLKGWILKASF